MTSRPRPKKTHAARSSSNRLDRALPSKVFAAKASKALSAPEKNSEDGGSRRTTLPATSAPTPKLLNVFSLRMPPDLHRRLQQRADAAKPARSINAEILDRLERSLGPNGKLKDTLSALEMPEAVRLRYIESSYAIDKIIEMAEDFDVERVVFAVKPDPLHDNVLIVVLQTASHTIVIDRANLTATRPAREAELKRLLAGLSAAGAMIGAQWCSERLPKELPANVVELAPLILQHPSLQPLTSVEGLIRSLKSRGISNDGESVRPRKQQNSVRTLSELTTEGATREGRK